MDEADRLLELGFWETLKLIFEFLPKQRRTGLFSATQTEEMNNLIKLGLRNPCVIQVKQKGNKDAQKTPLKLNNYYMVFILNNRKRLNNIPPIYHTYTSLMYEVHA